MSHNKILNIQKYIKKKYNNINKRYKLFNNKSKILNITIKKIMNFCKNKMVKKFKFIKII